MCKRGIYFLANDRVYDLAVAFLNSFRTHNKEFPLCLIPFDSKTTRIMELAKSYQFEVLDSSRHLAACDVISQQFHGRVIGHYRKLMSWNGPFEQFIYIDIDTVVLRPLNCVFPLLDEHDVVVAHSNEPGSRQFVWRREPPLDVDLSEGERAFAANTGFILSRRELLHLDRIHHLVQKALPLARYMDLDCYEQPLLNYLFVKSTARYTSIRVLNQSSAASMLPQECWAGDDNWNITADGVSTYRGIPRDVLHVHWAGEIVPRGIEAKLYSFLARFGIKRPIMKWRVKQGRLWRHYRHLAPPKFDNVMSVQKGLT